MKTAVIVPLHNQSKYWNKILIGLQRQSVKPDLVIAVVDRPDCDKGPLVGSGEPENATWDALTHISTQNSEFPDLNITIEVIYSVPAQLPRTADGKIFLAGMARNVGLEAAIRQGCTNFIFIDGDCVPESDLVKAHNAKLGKNLPILTVGRRRERQYRFQDRRESVAALAHLQLFRDKGTVINEHGNLIKDCMVVWSCNIGINLYAVNLIKKLNYRYFQRKELFSSDFLGAWGGEDSYLGIQAVYCRIFITTIGDRLSGVHHIDHPRPTETHSIEHKEYFTKQCNRLRDKVRLNPLDLDFFDYSGSVVLS